MYTDMPVLNTTTTSRLRGGRLSRERRKQKRIDAAIERISQYHLPSGLLDDEEEPHYYLPTGLLEYEY